MDYRWTKVKSLESLNDYIHAMDFVWYSLVAYGNSLSFVGNGKLGNADNWTTNEFPKSILKQLTYAEWIDVLLASSQKDWTF